MDFFPTNKKLLLKYSSTAAVIKIKTYCIMA
jgi:hypothetical protein